MSRRRDREIERRARRDAREADRLRAERDKVLETNNFVRRNAGRLKLVDPDMPPPRPRPRLVVDNEAT